MIRFNRNDRRRARDAGPTLDVVHSVSDILIRTAAVLALLGGIALMILTPRLAAAEPAFVDGVWPQSVVADADGICRFGGSLAAGERVEAVCQIGVAVSSPVVAQVETHSPMIAGWVIYSDPQVVIVTLHNVTTINIVGVEAQVRLMRAQTLRNRLQAVGAAGVAPPAAD